MFTRLTTGALAVHLLAAVALAGCATMGGGEVPGGAEQPERLGLALQTRTAFQVVAVPRNSPEQEDVARTVMGVIAALNAKDLEALKANYVQETSLELYGPPQVSPRTKGTRHHAELCIECLKAMKQMKTTANDDLSVRLSGPLAVATLTGVNEGMDENGNMGKGHWRWTVVLERMRNKWLISHEHLSFYDPAEVK